MKILHVADIHITLKKKKVPYDWQKNRFAMLFEKLLRLEETTDVTVITGDIFDDAPNTDEVCLFLSYVNSIKNPTIAIPGNHEATSKGKTFLEHFLIDHAINNPLFMLRTSNDRITVKGLYFQLFPYGEMQLNRVPEYIDGDILLTHIRGEVPPHITAEFDFDKIKKWPLTLIGDLHFQHKYKDYNIYYSGSPINTTFDRDDRREYGVNIVHYNNVHDYSVEFVNLDLPKLIRRTVPAGTDLEPDSYHHVIYEVTGSIDELAKVKKSDMLDKKMVEKPTSFSTLDLKDKSLYEELEIYLKHIKVTERTAILEQFKELGIQ